MANRSGTAVTVASPSGMMVEAAPSTSEVKLMADLCARFLRIGPGDVRDALERSGGDVETARLLLADRVLSSLLATGMDTSQILDDDAAEATMSRGAGAGGATPTPTRPAPRASTTPGPTDMPPGITIGRW